MSTRISSGEATPGRGLFSETSRCRVMRSSLQRKRKRSQPEDEETSQRADASWWGIKLSSCRRRRREGLPLRWQQEVVEPRGCAARLLATPPGGRGEG